jgi:hypothetical protein
MRSSQALLIRKQHYRDAAKLPNFNPLEENP